MDTKEVKVMQKILNVNDRIAGELRKELKEKNILFINLMSSPGSGKTTIMERTAQEFGEKMCVIEGDIQTTLDAERVAKAGIQTYQINTGPFGGDCHLESGWIKSAMEEIEMENLELIFVENIGNLVCPAEFDVGAHVNAVVLSVTEGEDKPLKYPLAFQTSQLCLIAKIDLLPYLDINIEDIKTNIQKVNPKMKVIELSAKTGEGFEEWFKYLKG
ncbi:MAG: hydrogenase nickel incorporation protein HypB [Candidatus Cloacimonetes bacterium]|nr:hydrogenase nickel incorporation protein HypB [Candidatus Cloacimonadota bacterium]MCF7814521.1 hydrogenase nickel incorporation protein HypB [Candidatus Cloacimonadota bacterium]MCF7867687.1 hydrogenase nickel incorporation protein HypB [Candidatus Cloacimonadota bacterium]MCF7883515.1 hydrogenase nickel incorporation protein HypB [Candidatus Cloacimonadota bacterium]